MAPPKQELSREDRIAVNMGGDAPTTPAPGGIAGTGVTVFLQTSSVGAPPPPPETFGAYSKKSEESNGVMGMIDLLVSDLDKAGRRVATGRAPSSTVLRPLCRSLSLPFPLSLSLSLSLALCIPLPFSRPPSVSLRGCLQ